MTFSEARLSFLAHHIIETLKREKLADVDNERLVLTEIKRVLNLDHERHVRIDASVRKKIASLSRNVPDGSREWDILYQRYFEEELRRHKT